MWTILDPNTFCMAAEGGTLYRYSDNGGHALCFVPWREPYFTPSPPLQPIFTNTVPIGAAQFGEAQ